MASVRVTRPFHDRNNKITIESERGTNVYRAVADGKSLFSISRTEGKATAEKGCYVKVM